MHVGKDYYRLHPDPAIRLLDQLEHRLGLRSLERVIIVCAILYLDGDRTPGYSVERWWKKMDDAESTSAADAARPQNNKPQ